MTYLDFTTAVQNSVCPDGEAENLVANHKKYVLDALIDMQIKVPRLQQNHTDFILALNTVFHCNASIFDCPRGFITGLSTMVNVSSQCCDEIAYQSCSKAEMDCLLADVENCLPCGGIYHPYQPYAYFVDEFYSAGNTEEFCFETPDSFLDKPCRASSGFFCFFRGQIWVSPHLQSNEVVKLQWSGVKRSFADMDILDDTLFDREVMECCELYLRGKQSAIEDADYTRALLFNNESPQRPGQYQMRRGDLIHSTTKETVLPPRNYCFRCGC